ncbi:Fic family protein [Aureimonas altamirensis]|uniref:Fic/DOC family protein n=1 Tax=Aureimonas altamirensis TaxID=370622 RepID=UPI0020372AA7|nr:Fic family protein [Aureimonas altamirensis]MCM2503690.1 Fic family protein [Aureimonas altamirensis]
MAYAVHDDPDCYPGTTVLRNLLDIREQSALDEAETLLFLLRADEALPKGNFDAAHLLDIHRHLFQDVFIWAGRPRTVRIGKAGNWFCYPEFITHELGRAFDEYGPPDAVAALPFDLFVTQTTHLVAEINAIHPFRDGNGRTQLTFLSMMAANAGYRLDETILQPDDVLSAMIDSFHGDERPLALLIGKGLSEL